MSDPQPQSPWKPEQVTRASLGSLSSGPNCIAERPKAAERIGFIVSCWAGIEFYLCESFGYLMDAEGWVAAELFRDIGRFDRQRAIFLNATRRKLGVRAKAYARGILDPLQDLKEARDDLAHANFIVPQTIPDAIAKIEGWGKGEQCWLYRIETLDALKQEFHSAGMAALDMHWNLIHATPIRYESGRLISAAHPQNLQAVADFLRGKGGAPDQQTPENLPPQTDPSRKPK